MAILRSNGIAEFSSAPVHTPTGNQGTFGRLTESNTFYYWDGAAWVTIIIGDDTAYNATTWNGNLNVPTMNAIRDKIEAMSISGVPDGDYGDITVSGGGTVYTIDTGLNVNKLADGSVSNAEFQYLNGVTSNIQTQLDAKALNTEVVHDTGAENIAGVKTFTDGLITIDQAYNESTWNANLEVPTKNAIRDKIESILSGLQTGGIYKAIWTQTGTGNPTASEKANTLSGSPTLTRNAEGVYFIDLVNAFLAGTIFPYEVVSMTTGKAFSSSLTRVNDDRLQLEIYDSTGTLAEIEGTIAVGFEIYS